jgi:hypothetical protein
MEAAVTDATTEPQLSRTEWQAVSIGLQDAARYGCRVPPRPGSLLSGLARLWRLLTGAEAPGRLADPRLEALRDFVCATRRRRRPADEVAPALLEQGFNGAQIKALALLAR